MKNMKKVAHSCPFVPAEWIAAHGLQPCRIMPHCIGTDPLPLGPTEGVCPYAGAFIRHVLSDGQYGAVIFTTTCDQMRRGAELVSRSSDTPCFLMNIPATWQTPAAIRIYTDEIHRLGRFLECIGGPRPSDDDLRGVMKEHESQRRRLREIRGCVSEKRYSQLVADFREYGAVPAGEITRGSVIDSDAPRVAVTGGPLLRDHFELFDLLAAAGGRMVLDATDTGYRTLPAPLDPKELIDDPFGQLVDAYFGSIPAAFRRPNGELYKWLHREISEREVQGIIVRRYVWCDTWHAEVRRIKEKTALPVLDLDVVDDQRGVRLAGEIEAFVEMLR